MQFEVTNKTSGTHKPLGTATNHDDARGVIGKALLEALSVPLEGEDHVEFVEATKGIAGMQPGDYLEVPFRNFKFAVRMLELEGFDRDAYAAALETINEAMVAVRNAAVAANIIGRAGEEFGIDPFKDIASCYGLLAHSSPALAQLESAAFDAATYFPKAGS